MRYPEIKRYLFALKTILAGLLTTQVIGTVHVYISNRALSQSLQMVDRAGYLPVPNEHVWETLQGVGAALGGGLFFTLSLGAGISVVSLSCAWIWDRLFGRSKLVLFIYLLLWCMAIAAVNTNGVSALATAYIVITAPLVFLAALFWLPPREVHGNRFLRIAYFGVPVCLILVFLPLAKGSIFHDVRDTILLSNSIGRKINAFYYDYTLYAAQAVKSLEQKTIRTCSLTLTENESHRPAIENIFRSHDYLVINGDGLVDLVVVEQDDNLLLISGDRTVFTMTLRDFAAKPSDSFRQFSQKTDRFGPLRLMTFISMVIGGPFCLYIIMHGFFFVFFILFMKPQRAGFSSLLLCLLAGITIALPLYGITMKSIDAGNVKEALESGHWKERVAALRYMEQNGLHTEQLIAEAESRLKSPHIAERYWYVRALGSSKSPAAGKALLAALDDPNINVVCMGFYSLGRRGDGSVTDEIIRRIGISGAWYEQRYAYRALRSIGWRQKRKQDSSGTG